MPDDDTNLDEGKEDSDNSTNDGDDGISDNSATDFTIYVIGAYYTSAYSVVQSTSSSYADEGVRFNVDWYDENGNANQSWGSNGYDMTTYRSYGDTVSVSTGEVDNLSYFYYHYEPFLGIGVYKRYLRIDPYNNDAGDAVCCGVTLNLDNSNCRTSSTGYRYLSNGNLYTTSSNARTNCASVWSATAYVVYREKYRATYHASGASNIPSTQILYAGVGYTMSSLVPQKTGYIFTGWSFGSEGGTNLNEPGHTFADSWVLADDDWYANWTPITYTVSFSGGSGASGSKSSITATYDSWFSVTKTGFSKTGYTFAGWSISGCTSGVTHYYGTGTSSSSYSTTTSTSITHSITGTGYYKNLRSSSGTVTFTARWTINTYTLTIKFTQYATNATNLNIYQASCTISNSLISNGQTATVSHTYTTGSYSVRLRFSNASSSCVYFLNIGSRVTSTTNYDALMTSSTTSYYYSWKPDSNDTITVYACQRYAISFNGNGYTSGTVPSTVYKVHGYAATIPANSLTRTSYTANGWNANASGTGTHFTTSYGYSTGNVTLYADWTARTATAKVQIRTSTNGTSYSNSVTGGTVSVQYYRDVNNTVTSTTQSITSASLTTLSYSPLISREITFTGTAKTGYTFVGVSTSTSPPATSTLSNTFTPTSSGSTYTVYVFFKVKSDNQLKYDSTDRYWYFEDGKYPQSYVGNSMNSTLINSATASGSSIRYFNGTSNVSISIYTYGGNEYARLRASSTMTIQTSVGRVTFTSGRYYFFEVEPIRWRVSEYGVSSTDYPDGWDAYGSYKTNFTVVSDRVLMASAVTNDTVREGWAFTSSELFSNVSISNTNSASAYADPKYDTSRSVTYYRYGNAGQQDKVTTVSRTENGLRVASVDEIKESFEDIRAYASDMVCFLLGIGSDEYANYWTRTLGTNLGNGKIITAAGMDTSSWLDNMFGVRFAMTMGEGSRI